MSPRPDEKAFENHFCHQLEVADYQQRENSDVDKDLCQNLKELIEFLETTQPEELRILKTELGQRWKEEIVNAFRQGLEDKPLFEILREGLQVYTQHLRLVHFKPQTSFNPEEAERYKKNRFTYVRQFTIGQESIDLVLFLNGFAIATIELKNNPTVQTINDAINQYLQRDLSLPIFNQPFVHITADNEEAKYATNFETRSADGFRPFNRALKNEPEIDRDYATHYLYHDVLTPDSLLGIIQSYLYPKEKNEWIFPRYHQRRAVERIFRDIQEKYLEAGALNLRYLVQHSAGSGKSNTIVWLVQRLRDLFVKDEKLFDSIIVVTDRINLDDQLSRDFQKAIGQVGVVHYCRYARELAVGLRANKKVIVSTIQKFSFIQEELAKMPDKRICFVIDEGHRSQDGELHTTMVETFFDVGKGEEISRKEFPNSVFVALTATPSERTLQRFGIRVDDHWEPFDVYSMDEAIAEGYILNVVKNVITYETLYELNYKYDSENEYPPLQIYRGLRLKAFENDEVIREKVKIMLTIFKQQTAPKIGGQAKAMVVASSRLAAVKYKLFLDEALKRENLPYKAVVAFTGTIELDGNNYTEANMNGFPDSKTAEQFEKPENRFLIMANKFQTGFDQPLLHTMFLDKSVSDINAVQTLSRLNRIYPPLKEDTLVVDFTDSYDEIIKAFRRFQGNVISKRDVNPDDLARIYNELLKKGVFTRGDVEEAIRLLDSDDPSATAQLAGLMHRFKTTFKSKLEEEEQRVFRTLLGRYVHYFDFVKSLFVIPAQELHDFRRFAHWVYNYLNPRLSAEELRRELEHAKLQDYRIRKVQYEQVELGPIDESRISSGDVVYVRRLATVREIVEAINERFAELISVEDSQLLEQYLQGVVNDEELLADVWSNLDNDREVVYTDILEPKMRQCYSAFVINHAAERYLVLMNEEMLRFVNKGAYEVLRQMARSKSFIES